jgi:hypothetical protein
VSEPRFQRDRRPWRNVRTLAPLPERSRTAFSGARGKSSMAPTRADYRPSGLHCSLILEGASMPKAKAAPKASAAPMAGITMRQALTDRKLLGSVLAGDSWLAWRILLIAAMGEPLTDDERVTFKKLTGREREPGVRCLELLIIAGVVAERAEQFLASSFTSRSSGPTARRWRQVNERRSYAWHRTGSRREWFSGTSGAPLNRSNS